MKAVVYTEYGSPDVLRLAEVAKPVPAANQVLIRVRAVNVGYGDLLARNFSGDSRHAFNMPSLLWWLARMDFGFTRPKRAILGAEFAGEIEATGENVTRFHAGDQVFAFLGSQMGANVEYVCMAEDALIGIMPANMSHSEAATMLNGALTALSLLRKVTIEKGTKVMVVGASGSIGVAAVQLAKARGAEVTGVCGTARMGMVKALGADRVIDYTREDIASGAEKYDVILDVLGKQSFARMRVVLKPHGVCLYASFKTNHLLRMLWTAGMSSQKVICALSSYRQADVDTVKSLIEAGTLKAVVDRQFPLEQAAEAHRYMESGRRTAAVVLTAGA